jgi:uncharacterized ubiquitin-like protein YukD
MENIIITLYFSVNGNVLDLEVPNNVPSEKLSEVVVKSFHLNAGNYLFRIKKSGKVIKRDESLAEAGVWDGEELEILPTGSY